MSIGSKFEFCLLELLRCGREEGGADWGLGGATLGQVCRCLLILGGGRQPRSAKVSIATTPDPNAGPPLASPSYCSKIMPSQSIHILL